MLAACCWGSAAEEGGASRRDWARATASACGGAARREIRPAAAPHGGGAARRGSVGPHRLRTARRGRWRLGAVRVPGAAVSARAASARGGAAQHHSGAASRGLPPGSARGGSGAGALAISGSAGRILARPLPCVPDFLLRGFFGSAAPDPRSPTGALTFALYQAPSPGLDIFGRYPSEVTRAGRGTHCACIWCRSREGRGGARPNSSLQVRRRDSCHCWRLR